jgi:hypothetical protein
MRNRLLTLAGALALIAVLGHFYAKPLLAQVRAALVQNVDEPGRNPIPLGFLSVIGNSEADFSVPAGKRYVIEAFTGRCFLDSASSLTAVEVTATTPFGPSNGQAFAQAFRTNANGGISGWAASTTTRLYVNPGATIHITAVGNTTVPTVCEFTVSGYAINLP